MFKIHVRKKISLCDLLGCLFILWVLNPMTHEYLPFYWIGLIYSAWFVAALLENGKALSSAITDRVFIVSWMFCGFLLLWSIIGLTQFEKSSIGFPFIVLFSLFYFKTNNTDKIRFFSRVVIIFFMMMALYTIYQLRLNPYISRLIATGKENTMNMATPLTAGYYEIYYLVFFFLAIMGIVVYKWNDTHRIIYLSILLILCLLFLKAMYTIAVLLCVLGAMLLLSRSNKLFRTIFILIVALFALMLLFHKLYLMADVFYDISSVLPEGILKNRFIQMGDHFSLGSNVWAGRNGMDLRLSLYARSWETFIANFFAGAGNDSYTKSLGIIGDHSTLFDTFAMYGVIGGGLYFLSHLFVMVKIRNKFELQFRFVYLVLILVYIILCLLNKTNRNSIAMMIVVVIPFLLFLESKDRQDVRIIGN